MIGWVHAMEPGDYQAWLAGGAASESLASAGGKLFQRHACNTCHRPDSLARGPNLEGLFGKQVQLADGRTVVVDESYLRESILNPNAKTVAGFQPIMPTFQGLVSEEELLQLVAYVKSLSKPQASPPLPAGEGRGEGRSLPPSNRAAPPTPSGKENPK
jgi:cytochrome c oxidase subunit 2